MNIIYCLRIRAHHQLLLCVLCIVFHSVFTFLETLLPFCPSCCKKSFSNFVTCQPWEILLKTTVKVFQIKTTLHTLSLKCDVNLEMVVMTFHDILRMCFLHGEFFLIFLFKKSKRVAFSAAFLTFSFWSLSALVFSLHAVEDVANLTASDVMNRVNLGYLQGKCTQHHCSCGIGLFQSIWNLMFWRLK